MGVMAVVNFRDCIHPREYSRLAIALIFALPVTLLALAAVLLTFGILLIFVGLILLFVWIGFNVLYANFVANSVRVSERNYPRLLDIREEMRDKIGVKKGKKIDIFVYQQGEFNTYLKRMFTRRAIFVNSELLDQGVSDDELRWLFGRFLGKMRSRQRLGVVGWMLTLAERLIVFNLFLLPFERATAYSGDRIALAAIGGDLNVALSAMNKLLVGRNLGYSVNPAGIVEQNHWVRASFFAFLARLPSNLPHTLPRYVDLIGFARQKYPDSYQRFVAQNPSFQSFDMPATTNPAPASKARPNPAATVDPLQDGSSDGWGWGLAPIFVLIAVGGVNALLNMTGVQAYTFRLSISLGVFLIAALAAILALRAMPRVRELSLGGGLMSLVAVLPAATLIGLIYILREPSLVGTLLSGDLDLDISRVSGDKFLLGQLVYTMLSFVFLETALRGVFIGGQLHSGNSPSTAIPLAAVLGAIADFCSSAFWGVPVLFAQLTDPWRDLDFSLVQSWLLGAAIILGIGLASGLLRMLTGRAWPSIVSVSLGGVAGALLIQLG